jgi:AraC-like DNA-binding protein
MAVVDPLLTRPAGIVEIERLRAMFPSLPVVLYTTLIPDIAGVLLALGRTGIRTAIFSRLDDHPAAFRAALAEERIGTASEQVRQAIGRLLGGPPARVRWVLETVLRVPAEGQTVEALARRAHLNRRTYERLFARCGLPSPRTLVMIVRVLYAHRLLLDPGYTVEDVAVKLGYNRIRTLQIQFKEVFGLTAGELRMSLGAEQALEIVAERYFPQARQAAS